MQSPTPPPLTKEYVHVGTKVAAVDEPGTGPIPHIQSIDHSPANPGDSIPQFNITGTNMATVNFIATDNPLLHASFISASATTVTGSLSIDPLCPSGNHQIWVLTTGSQRSDNNGVFVVNAPAGGPAITDISPGQARPGDSFTMTITGTGLAAVNQVNFTTSAGQPATTITVTKVTPQSGSGGATVTANVAVSSSAARRASLQARWDSW